MFKNKIIVAGSVLVLSVLACSSLSFQGSPTEPEPTLAQPTNTPLLEVAVDIENLSPDEPVFISGTIPYTSPFFLDMATEPFVLLEDQAGFAARDLLFEFPLSGQTIGPVWQIDDGTMGFSLSLPLVPQGTLLDLDNNGREDRGVMVFGVAFWSNIWGGPFLEEREGTGWSGAYTTTITDPNQDYEITGGHLVIWAPDGQQQFPSGFGEDGLLFTEDDPVVSVPAGYSIVNLDEKPFQIYKEAEPVFELIEGSGAVKDYSDMSYMDAFNELFSHVRVEYPFTKEKNIDWDQLYEEFGTKVAKAKNDEAFYAAMDGFLRSIPDGHVGMSFNADYFWENFGGGIGIVVDKLSNGSIIVTQVIENTPAEKEGILPGAEITEWNGMPAAQALSQVVPVDGTPSTPQALLNYQLASFNRVPLYSEVSLSYINPGGSEKYAVMKSVGEVDSLLASYGSYDPISLPIEGHMLDSGLAYLRINSFSDNENLTAELWTEFMENIIDNEIPGIIIDIRDNGGGSGGLALNFADYFFNEEIIVSQHGYYNEDTGEFDFREDTPTKIEPAPLYYDGPVVLLVSPDCVSACEGFAFYMTQNDRAIVFGHAGTAGAFGEVGRGQYKLPGDIELQFPTGRPETPDGELVIEDTGIQPDVVVPVTFESAMGEVDAVLDAAESALLKEIK